MAERSTRDARRRGTATATRLGADGRWAAGQRARRDGPRGRVADGGFSCREQSGDTYGYMTARSLLGGVRANQGSYDEAAALFAANETALHEAGDESWLGHASFHLGVIAWVQGDDARARVLLRDAVERFDRSRAPANAIDPLRYLGHSPASPASSTRRRAGLARS